MYQSIIKPEKSMSTTACLKATKD